MAAVIVKVVVAQMISAGDRFPAKSVTSAVDLFRPRLAAVVPDKKHLAIKGKNRNGLILLSDK